MNGLNKLNKKKTIDNKNILDVDKNKIKIKVCESDDDISIESIKKSDDKIVDNCDGDKKDGNVKKKRIRPTKAQLYKEERLFILNKLNNILGITNDNKTFILISFLKE